MIQSSAEFAIVVTGVLLLGLYLAFTFRFRRGYRVPEPVPAPGKPFVTVVIAARNEEQNLSALLTGLLNQSYPPELFEVIVADDESTDNTVAVVESFAERLPNLRCLRVVGRERAASPKKNALQQAVDAARGEIILATDADCLVARWWIESMVAHFRPGIEFVAGFSRTWLTDWKSASSAQRFEFIDFYAIFAAAGGAILAGTPFSCSGQNLGFRREAFRRVGGYSSIAHLLSGDDVHLMHLFRRAGLGITFARNRHTFVYTRPVRSWGSLINQRARWASNARQMAKTDFIFFFYLTIAFLLNISLPVTIVANPFFGVAILAIKATADFRFLNGLRDTFLIDAPRLRFFPVWFLLQPLYMILVAVLGLPGLFRWQGRTPRRTI